MAFSKAKIMRFNDIKTCAPPPGAYNPKFDEHVPGVKYVKENNKSEPQSPASTASDAQSVRSESFSFPSFRTPTIPHRKNIKISNSAGSRKAVFSPQKSEALREKIVECINKDETITDLENQLEELKFAISRLSVEKNNLVAERDELLSKVEQVQIEIGNLNKQVEQVNFDNNKLIDEYDKTKVQLKAENTAQLKQFQENLNLLQECLNEHKIQVEMNEKNLENKILAYNKLENEFQSLSEEYAAFKLKYEELLQMQTDLKNNHFSEIENLYRIHETETSKLQLELQKDYETKIKDLETEKKIEFEKLQDVNMSEKSELTQCVNDLKLEKEQISTELEIIKTKLQQEENEHQKEKSAALAEKHRYEITLNKTCETVNALKNRLLNSDRDVEQLTRELEALEKSKFETEERYLEENEKLKKENEELKSGQGSLMILQEEVEMIKVKLLEKLDLFKIKANSEISRLTTVVEKQSIELKKLHFYIQDQQKVHNNAYALISDAKIEMEKLEKENSEYKLHISRLEAENDAQRNDESDALKDTQIKELKDQLKVRDLEINELASIYKKYIEKSRLYDELQQKQDELEKKCECLETKISEQNFLIGPFREQLENYERECQILLLHKGEAEKEAKEMGLKYAQILGHQNYKQKLHHIVDLKKRNIELMECKQNYESKILQQSRTIEKLKQKICQQTKTPKGEKNFDKENMCSPVRTPNVNSPVRTPRINSPIALKERN